MSNKKESNSKLNSENERSAKKMSDDDLARLKRNSSDLPSMLEYAHSIGGFSVVPTNEGAIKKQALMIMQEQTEDKLSLIYEQMQVLARQARDIQDRVKISEKIYFAKFKFEPIVGKIYYLYRKEQSDDYSLSMIGPEEWGSSCSLGNKVAMVKLLADHTWKVYEDYEKTIKKGKDDIDAN